MYSNIEVMIMLESGIVGNSSLEISRSTKGEYSYSLKIYFSGSSISSIKRVVDRSLTGLIYLEQKFGISSKEKIDSDEK